MIEMNYKLLKLEEKLEEKLKEKLKEKGFAPEADRHTLARRTALVLTGLPPEEGQLEQFLEGGNYEALVDQLIGSERFGEHQARYWLDAVRYGDTHGLHLDNQVNCAIHTPSSFGATIIMHDASCKGSINYLNFAREILQKNNATKMKAESKQIEEL